MAAYAAVTSLMGTIHLISQSNLHLKKGHKEHLKLLYEKVGSLLEYLDNSDDEPVKDLQKKFIDLAHEAEDKIESQVRLIVEKDEQIPAMAHWRLLKILRRAIHDIGLVKEKLVKQRKNNNLHAGNRSLGISISARSYVSTLENDMVGYNIEQQHMQGQLTGHSSELEVISIAGMGGIGKSTFAKRMFFDPSILSFFDVRGWITVSKDYSLRKMLLCLLQDTTGVKEKLDNLSDIGELADHVQKSLKGRRYLIVVDDIWSTEAWDEIRMCFPENSNRSRILLTTRDMKVAQYASFPKDPFPMRFLEPEESWNLFCQKAFGKIDCPTKFENIAKVIVENCKGLPLMISVVAGTLSSKRTLSHWTTVAQSVSSLVNLDDYQRCSGLLALSYSQLPSHLKACFLYFGVFPKASEISVKKLIRLWAAEGLLEPTGHEGLEKVSVNLLHDLIDKSLVVVSKQSLEGKIKTCRIHDLLHDLCLKEAESDNLLYVVDPPISRTSIRVCPQGRRWVSVHSIPCYFFSVISFDDHSKRSCFPSSLFHDLTYSKTRSLHFISSVMERHLELGLDHFKLLRVLDLDTLSFGYFPSEILQLVSLRYLAVIVSRISTDLPISNLWNLQTIIVPQDDLERSGTMYLPNGIWEMSQLRHLHSTRMYLYSPSEVSANEVKYRVLENLQSVSGLSPHCCTKEIFEGIKKVKKLGISGTEDEFDSEEDMKIISMLPKLEVLKLKRDAFASGTDVRPDVWEVTEMGFPELKFLLVEELRLDYWRATDDYFPSLECIIVRNCRFLIEIPQGFADSMTLQLIELYQCSPSLVSSAEQIQKEQLESFGDNMLKVYAFDTIRE
ncbi:putative late blight resistance protein homolog R1A-10 [Lycium barbarum]|uniref:putative late blight resistance protein homolog R1A-10 n=1 Tax=Lycium barbarum TaxID=112863 RepID=UPI00293F3B89|nr:putative late blight resistance protein homolog R1A-10 [Lycium barbarum]